MTAPLGMGSSTSAPAGRRQHLQRVARNIGLRVVADKGSIRPGYGFGLLVRKDHIASGRFKSYKDLKGMKIAVGTFGSSNSSAVNEHSRRAD